ncbi:MAG: hypothetical protein ACI9JL_001312 [Paracoccaceae bacterium]|jgi:hypothetical protein
MPTERRRIIFSDDEIVSAALSHCRTTGIPVPDAEVEKQTIATDGDCHLLLTFAVSSPDQIDEVRLDADSVLSALIEYCRVHAVPLPKAASKRLDPQDGAVSMVFDMQRQRGSVVRTIAA